MKLYYGGAEVPSHRKWLADSGITDTQLSFLGLRRRIKNTGDWLIKDKLPESMNVLLDSGAYTVNKDESIDPDALAEMASAYIEFVAANIDRVDAVTEFDALALGGSWIQGMREDFYDDLGDKFMPVWHPESGVEDLERLAGRYRRIGILRTALGDRDIIPVLNMLAVRRGTLLHGIAMTKPSVMREVRWDSVGSTSWLSPMQYGDTFVWTGQKLKRFPKKYKERARKQYRTLFTSAGFDAEKIAQGDTTEITKLSLWSWQRLLDDLNSHRMPREVMRNAQPHDVQETGLSERSLLDEESRHETRATPVARQRILLPGVSLKQDKDDQSVLNVAGASLRQCDTCFLRDRGCPGYAPGHSCLYELPIEAKSAAQIKGIEAGLIAMQTQRVMFMRMTEDLEGGYPDPNLSSEIDRLTRMIKAQREGSMDKFSLHISGSQQASGEAGAISRIFGQEAAAAQSIGPPKVVDDMIRESMMGEVFEGEVVDG